MVAIDFHMDFSEVAELSQKYPEISLEVRMSKVTEAIALLEREIKRNTPYGAGPIHLRDSIAGSTQPQGQRVVGIVGTPLIHGEPVEYGTKPHFPPVDAIKFWVERKIGLHGKEAKSVAFLIARSISKKGTKGVKMFGDTFKDNRSTVERILGGIPAEIAQRATA